MIQEPRKNQVHIIILTCAGLAPLLEVMNLLRVHIEKARSSGFKRFWDGRFLKATLVLALLLKLD